MSTSDSAAGEGLAAKYEAGWAWVASGVIFVILAMVVFTAVNWSSMPPSRVEVIDASTLHLSGEFVEDNLGTEVDSSGRVIVRLLAQQYAFRPSCLVLPEGEPVTFRATSSDAVHGLQILGTNINSMVVPGYVATFIATVRDPGEYAMPCHEFCGAGHASMWARVQVLPKPAFDRLAREKRRLSCA